MTAEYPHNLDAERAVLGGLLLKPDAWHDVRDILAPEDFYREAHTGIYAAMSDVVQAGRTIDLVALADAVSRRPGGLDAIGGLSYLTRLVDGLSRGMARPSDHAIIVCDHAQRRRCLLIGRQLIADASSASDVDDARTQAERALRELVTGTRSDAMSAEQAVAEAVDILERYESSPHQGITGIASGLYSLDHLLGGWQPGDLVVIAARPSVGKTAFAGQVAAYAAIVHHVPVVFATNEQSPRTLALRMASNRTKVNVEDVREQRTSEADLRRLFAGLTEVRQAPLTFLPARGRRMSDIRREARRLHAQGKCRLLVIDYLGLVAPESSQTRGETRERQVAVQSGMAKTLASELEIPVLLLCQLNRQYEQDQPKPGSTRAMPRRPRLSDLRESGAVEQDADVVLFVHRPFVRPASPEERLREGQTELVVAKHRNGSIGEIPAHYAKEWVRFEEVQT